jgi:type I restriction enzyme, S subunit
VSEWTTVKLADAPLEILDGDRGKNYPSQDEFSDNGHCLFLSTKNVRAIGFDFSECQFISKERDELLRKGRLERNDVVLTTRGTVGNLGFFNENVGYKRIRINSGMVIIRPDESKLLPAFNFYTFRKLQSDFLTFTSGSAQPQLPIRDLKEIEISIPPLEEQKAIASVLSSLDDKIDLLHRQNTTLERMAETLFRQWFVEEAQEDWEEKPLSFYGEIVCGKTPSKQNHSYFNGEVPFIKIPDMHGNPFIFKTEDTLTELGKSSQNNKTVPPYSICVSCIATVGLVSITTKPSQTNQQINTIVPCHSKYRYFLYLTMKASYDLLHAEASGGTATLNLNTGNFSRITVPLPPDSLLLEFETIVDKVFNKIYQNQAQIQTLEKLRDNLLPKLMSGEVTIKVEVN